MLIPWEIDLDCNLHKQEVMPTEGIIYLARNTVNNKIYIGQTTSSLNRRRSNHFAASRNESDRLYFHKAIRKYGEDAFDWSVLEAVYANSKEELESALNEKEIQYISIYNSNNCNAGYNLTSGGDAHTEMAQSFWNDDDRSGKWRKTLSDKMSKKWSNEENRKQHQEWMIDFYKTDIGVSQAKRHSEFMTDYYSSENARRNKAKTAHWFVRAISPEEEEMIFISSKEPNQFFGKDIKLRQRLKEVGDVWKPTVQSFLYGWTFEAIEKYTI